MSKYSMDMSEEKAPRGTMLLDRGWRKFNILACEENVSKAGNKMSILSVEDDLTGNVEDVYAIMTKGKRWFLKSILTAVGCEAGEDGKYNWSPEDILNKSFEGFVIHEPNNYINRDGNEVKKTVHKIVKARAIPTEEEKTKAEVTPEEQKAWDS